MKTERCVLLAEDEPNDIFLFRYAFEQAEIFNPLKIVTDGQQAIDYLEGNGEFSDRANYPLPILVVLDVKMPRKTGLEVLGWLQQQDGLSALPTMVLSSSAHPDDVDKAYELGANAFIVKPPGTSQRMNLAKLIKDFWLTLNEPPRIVR